MTRRTRTFANVSDRDAATQIAGDHGLTPSIGIDGPTYAVLAQLNQSDLAFLRERARSIDAELWISDTTLNLQPRSKRVERPVHAHLRQGVARLPGHRGSRYPGHQRRGDGVGRGEQVGHRRTRRRRATRRRAPGWRQRPQRAWLCLRSAQGPVHQRGATDHRGGPGARRRPAQAAGAPFPRGHGDRADSARVYGWARR